MGEEKYLKNCGCKTCDFTVVHRAYP